MRELIRDIIRNFINEQRESWSLDKLKDISKNYTSLSEFLKNETKAAHAMRRLGVYDEYTSHMKRQTESFTDDEIETEARKYKNQADFAKGSPKHYVAFKRRKLQNKFRDFLPTKIKKWTDEMLKKEASKYSTLKDFIENSASAYKISQDRGIFDDITKHMPKIKVWTYDEAKDEAKKYNTFAEFVKNSPAYNQSRSHGWIKDFQEFLDTKNFRWTKELVQKEADKYKTRVEFKKNSPRAYSAAHQHGWIDDVTKDMIQLGHLYKRMVYAYEFSDNTVYVGLTLNKEKRHSSHNDLVKISSPVAKHILKTKLTPEFKVISDYIDAQDAQDLENCTIENYRQNGWNILNSHKGGGLGACRRFWTKDMVQKEAEKYTTRGEFKKNSKNAYQAAQKYGWLEELTKNMEYADTTVWKYDKVKELADISKNRSDLKNKSQSAYASALRNGWLDEFFPQKYNTYKGKR
jgi:hypothetical protein